MKIFELSFCIANLKNRLLKKYEVEGPNKNNSNQFMAFQNLLYNFLTINLIENLGASCCSSHI